MTRAKGMFISEFQKSFTNLGNLDYIMQRCSDGLVKDALLHVMLPEVKTIERRGAVHNFRGGVPYSSQAKFFLEHSSGKGFKWLVGDYESLPLDPISFWYFLKTLQQERPNKNIVIYSGLPKLRDSLLRKQGIMTDFGPIDFLEFDIWIARWPGGNVDPDKDEPDLTINNEEVIEEWTFWQYSADGNGKGPEYGCGSDDTNLDVFNGTVKDLDNWITGDEPMETKRPWESKTIIFFVLTLLVSIASLFGFQDFQMTPEMAQIAGVIVSIIGIILRALTKEGVGL